MDEGMLAPALGHHFLLNSLAIDRTKTKGEIGDFTDHRLGGSRGGRPL